MKNRSLITGFVVIIGCLLMLQGSTLPLENYGGKAYARSGESIACTMGLGMPSHCTEIRNATLRLQLHEKLDVSAFGDALQAPP